MAKKLSVDEQWRMFMTGMHPKERRNRHLFGLLPKDPRCKLCNAPFEGIGSMIMKLLYKKVRSKVSPRFCNSCENFAVNHMGGVEIEMSMLFADVRGSTSLAERMSPFEFNKILNRFYKTATDVLVRSDAFVDKLVGDEVIGLYIPAFAGPDHSRIAIESGKDLLRATGHGSQGGPWIPIGIGINTGMAFYGSVGTKESFQDVTALGDSVNITARLAQRAGAGEIIVSDASCSAARLSVKGLEERRLNLKGKSKPVHVRVLRLT